MTVKQDGTQVIVALATPPGWKDLPQTLQPVVAAWRRHVEEANREINLRMLGLAADLHQESFNQLPGDVAAKDGKKLLSWRVKVLPYFEDKALYEQFHFDEPWDSEHNRQLLAKMPPIFGKNKEAKTSMLAFAGEGTPLGGAKPMSMHQISDPGHTILLVEAGEDRAVPWTKPVDLPWDKANPAEALGTLNDGKFWAVFCDGHVEKLDAKMDPAKLTSMILVHSGATPPDPAPPPPKEEPIEKK